MRLTIALTVLFACGVLAAQNPATTRSDIPKLEGLNAAQQRAVEDYVRQTERPTGELRWIADRRMAVFSSEALRKLFPSFRFVAIRWTTEADPAAVNKYSIPGPIVQTLALDQEGRDRLSKHTGLEKEFGELLHMERVRVTDVTSAAIVRSAFAEIHAGGGADDLRTTDLRHENSNWLLGYHESPFRVISGYEEVREVSYYLISVDPNGFVVSGLSVTEVLERRKIKGNAPNH
jgi:hypothetical protein